MKKVLSLSFLLAASSILGHATTIFCSVIDGGIVSNAGTTAKVDQGGTLVSTPVFSCPSLDAGSGNLLSNVVLLGTGDYDGGPFGTITGTSVTEVFGVTTGPFALAATSLTVTGGNSSNATSIPVPFQLGSTLNPGTQTLAAFTVNLSSFVNSGTVAESSAQIALFYTTTSIVGPAPEPATLGLMGGALLGLGFLARRKK